MPFTPRSAMLEKGYIISSVDYAIPTPDGFFDRETEFMVRGYDENKISLETVERIRPRHDNIYGHPAETMWVEITWEQFMHFQIVSKWKQ